MSLDSNLIVKKITLEREEIKAFDYYPFNIDLNNNFKEIKYEETEIYSLYKMYLDNPDLMQHRLFD